MAGKKRRRTSRGGKHRGKLQNLLYGFLVKERKKDCRYFKGRQLGGETEITNYLHGEAHQPQIPRKKILGGIERK